MSTTLQMPPRAPSAATLKRPTDADYRRLVRATVKDMEALTARLAGGDLSPAQWADEFDALLGDSHTDAWVLGRQRAGDLTARQIEDEIMGLGFKDVQSEFLRGFQDAIESGDPRYLLEDGTLNAHAINQRAKLYAARLRGTANEAFVEAGEDDDEYEWKLGPTEHCDDCIELAALGPYTKDTTLGHPGDGQTACKVNCHCRWYRTRSGLYGFSRPNIYLS
jgi:hypothetical protein